MEWLLARLKEPSTYAGLGSIAAAVGVAVPPAAFVAGPLAALFGGLAAIMKDRAGSDPKH